MNIFTITDLTEGNIYQVTTEAVEGRKDESRPSKYNWPYQPEPSPPMVATWKQAIQHVYTTGNMSLKTPLGIWTKESHQHFNSFLSDNEVHAFLWRNNKWDKFWRSRFNRRRTVYRLIEQDCELSAIVHPTTVSNVTATMLHASATIKSAVVAGPSYTNELKYILSYSNGNAATSQGWPYLVNGLPWILSLVPPTFSNGRWRGGGGILTADEAPNTQISSHMGNTVVSSKQSAKLIKLEYLTFI